MNPARAEYERTMAEAWEKMRAAQAEYSRVVAQARRDYLKALRAPHVEISQPEIPGVGAQSG